MKRKLFIEGQNNEYPSIVKDEKELVLFRGH